MYIFSYYTDVAECARLLLFHFIIHNKMLLDSVSEDTILNF